MEYIPSLPNKMKRSRFRVYSGVILVKMLLVCSTFVASASIRNTFKENHLTFGYKPKKSSESVFDKMLYNKKVIFGRITYQMIL